MGNRTPRKRITRETKVRRAIAKVSKAQRVRHEDREPCYRGCSEAECDCSRCLARAEFFDDGQEYAALHERDGYAEMGDPGEASHG